MLFKRFLLILAFLGTAGVAQALPSVYLPGQHYKVLSVPVPTTNPEKIEVREYFFYGCPHCYHALPLVNAWRKNQPADVDFEMTPVLFMRGADPLARAFYIAEAKGILDKVHDALFDAVQSGKPLHTTDALAGWFVQYGIPADEYKRLAASFGIESQVNQAKALTRAAQIEGVPAFLVDGRYLVLRENLPVEADTFKVIDYLVQMVRDQRSHPAK